ncbi:GRB10-interacting GYF protein 2 isoform X3 [Esox lucius]|uniref:GRB10-interacting GYF protein 2 isoform X3 n=1 Tax=Esox lucius TaxID=8010 RepID=UPI0005766956|nr:GRB10-interacting GYF protein 2 isoform X3 [Esox lucius]
MAETQTLNFGPEWLRALSGGGHGGGTSSVVATSPPLSPALPKYKLADYRYGREEMLALYVKDREIPVVLHDKDFVPILQEEPLPPLALVAFTEEEQRNFSMSVNSAAVLRLMGRGGPVGAGAPRGRSTSRGRGRGRGDGGFYQRSFDDVEGGFGRGVREMHRSQSWEESHAESIFSTSRGDRRFEKPGRKEPEVAPAHFPMNHIRATYEEVGTGTAGLPVRKHEFTRSESENWRTSRDEANGEDYDEGGWRLAGASRRDNDRWCPPSPDGQRSAVWREAHPGEQPRQRRFPFDAREDERGYRPPRSGSGSLEEDGASLPEWCLEDAEEETGTFDSSGAFLSLKKAPKEPILEEAELDFRPLEECDEGQEDEDAQPRDTKDTDGEARREPDRKEDVGQAVEEAPPVPTPPEPLPPAPLLPHSQPERAEEPDRPLERPFERPTASEHRPEANKVSLQVPMSIPMSSTMLESLPVSHTAAHTLTVSPLSAPSPTVQMQQKPLDTPVAVTGPLSFSAPLLAQNASVMAPNIMAHGAGLMALIGRPTAMPPHHIMDEDEGLKHFEQEAEKMVAYLQDGDDRLAAKNPKPVGLPLTHEAALKWFYKDPQGEIQGPFSNHEMTEWFQAGYFTMTLLVKRGCDEVFQALGEIIKMWGRVPFAPGPAPPPLLSDAGDQERLKRQQELTALNLYQLQQLQYQYLLRQQYAQALAQQKAQALSSAPHQQQQQQQQQINLLLQQYQALKMRTSETLLPPVTRSMSVPDSQASVWEIQNASSQASCTANIQQPVPSAWEGSSVWDLPIDSVAKAPTIEQMQELEKNNAVKVPLPVQLELERREAELRVKREEEERKRLEEALRARQAEEHKRLEEEELARHKQEEASRRLREQQEAAQRRQKEEEERQAQEEALRRLEERRREEEERKQREELIRKQEEERRKQEELETLRRRDEEKRLEEEAAAALARQQQEEAKRREQEAARQQELARQRQQQQEALRRLQQQQQQQQLAQMKLPSSSKWGQQSATAAAISQAQNALSLAEIQKVEEERERQAQEEQRRQQAELLKLQQQQALQEARQPQSKLSGWGSVAKQPAATKSLLEIQREEAQQMKQRKEQGVGSQQQPSHTTITQQNRPLNRAVGSPSPLFPQTTALSSSVWGSVATSGGAPNWAGDSSSIWGDSTNSNMGFWDEPVKEPAQPLPQAPPPTRKPNAQKNNKSNANISTRANKKVEDEEKLLKLFQGVNKSHQDGFILWCEQALHTLNTANNLDVPTFASFLKEVDSPYEVHDYVRAYLGDTSEAKEFAKQFLERRAKQNANQQKQSQAPQNQQQPLKQQKQQQQQDSVWGVSGTGSVYQSNHTSLQQQARFETVTSGKKKKKQKMVRADPSLLGFSVNAASERLNMGEIETVEDF